MKAKEVCGRFAPSPSGRMHLGNLLCGLIAWLSVRSQNGKMILRQEDLDEMRCPRSYAELIEQDLRWFGLDWDEGGLAGSGSHAPYLQSRRSEIYQQYLDKLNQKGLLYPCFCSRAQLHAASAPHLEDGQVLYPGTCRHLTPEQIAQKRKIRPPALRVKVPDETVTFTDLHYGLVEQNLATQCGDFILRRSDGVFAYQLAVTVDDGLMGVTQVIRGRDLLSSTPRQIWLLRELGFPGAGVRPQFLYYWTKPATGCLNGTCPWTWENCESGLAARNPSWENWPTPPDCWTGRNLPLPGN